MLIFVAIFGFHRLQTPSNLLLATLALSDAFVGLTVQPGYITYRLMENQHRSVPCFARHIYSSAFYVCFVLKYALGIWTVNIFLTAMEWAKIDKAMRGIHLTLWFLCLLFSTATQIVVFYSYTKTPSTSQKPTSSG
ncbi:unnamed protein product [Pocillopora meandrina]|uniref:G-protein coupled receptors family 1 profile domain-containing protein n=1 Tax=Pocillopora meandrina TaxID=46732 RepID=A0AAU9XXX2_9CNID|nr:unnamed protein product [Pocillopora meandrina]